MFWMYIALICLLSAARLFLLWDLSEVFKGTWSVTKCIHSSCILNHMQPYSSKQVNSSMHTIFHSHALLLPESTLLCISTLKWWIPGPGCWNLSAQKKKFHVQCIIYDQPENVRSFERSIFSLSISLHFSLSVSLALYLSEKYLCELWHQ